MTIAEWMEQHPQAQEYVAGWIEARADFVRHADLAIRGRTGRFDVFALPLR